MTISRNLGYEKMRYYLYWLLHYYCQNPLKGEEVSFLGLIFPILI